MKTDVSEGDPNGIDRGRDFNSAGWLESVSATDVLFNQEHHTAETKNKNDRKMLQRMRNQYDSNKPGSIRRTITFKEDDLVSNPLFDGLLTGMSIHTHNGQFLKVNSFFCKMLGYRAQELSAKNIKDIIDAEFWEAAMRVMKQWNPGRKSTVQEITHALHKDGYRISILMNLSVILNRRGDVTSYLLQWMPTPLSLKSDEKIRQSQEDREELLKEIHHRVKNNLQIISSLLNLQSRLVKDSKASDLFKISQDRIHSMALVHEKLYYSTNFKKVDFADYIHSLFQSLRRNYYHEAKDITLTVSLEELNLPVRIAIPCGLILNELLSNAIKHAFDKTPLKEQKIGIDLRRIGKKEIELKVRDNGVGMPKDFRLRQKESLGLSLVSFLAKDQLQGRFEWSRKKIGTEFTIQFRI